MTDNSQRIRAVVAAQLESLARAGVMQLPKARARVAVTMLPAELVPTTRSAPPAELSPPSQLEAPPAEVVTPSPPRKEATHMPKTSSWKTGGGTLFADPAEAPADISQAASLEVLQHEVASCMRCSELASLRTQTVFGVGNPQARLCFMGEAPGADEDRLGEPFVGRGGQLLTKIIEACQMKREDVYILNTIKCRPPGNRNPHPDELSNCRRFLERQLELIEPEFICCLGAVASQNLLNTTVAIGKLRGKLHQYRGAKVVCTFHPAYLLRNPAAKKDCWDDMKFLMREMGVEI